MHAFTEPGVAMLASVLVTAVKISIQKIDAFTEMRKFLRSNTELLVRLETVERKHVILQHETDQKFDKIFNALESGDLSLDKVYFTFRQILYLD